MPIPEEFAGRVMNIHPALIPAFCGKGFYGHHVHEKALEAGQLVWSQGDAQAGIYLISEGRIRSYYAAPSGREAA